MIRRKVEEPLFSGFCARAANEIAFQRLA
jgi:hypothetical protein